MKIPDDGLDVLRGVDLHDAPRPRGHPPSPDPRRPVTVRLTAAGRQTWLIDMTADERESLLLAYRNARAVTVVQPEPGETA